MSLTTLADAPAADHAASAAVSYDQIPYIPRRWLWDGVIPVGSPVVFAAAGGTGKGMLFCLTAAHVVLGLPFPGEDQETRRPPQRVVWLSGPGEDDQFEDMAPRLRAAIAVLADAFGLDPAVAGEGGAIRLVHDLSVWPDDTPVSIPADLPRIASELKAIPRNAGGPDVGMVVADSLSALLSDGYTIDSRQGATRVMTRLGRFARRADVALALLHHTTKGRVVAGSAGVLNSLRLAFVIEPSKDDPAVRMITRHKSNISDAEPLGYIITGSGANAHAEFVAAGEQRAARMSAAPVTPDPPEVDPASMRGRMAAAAAQRLPDPVPPSGSRAEPTEAEARAGVLDDAVSLPEYLRRLGTAPHLWEVGPYRVLRMFQPAGGRQTSGQLPGPLATCEAARAAAVADAGRALAWKAGDRPGMQVAVFVRADGARLGYAVCPPAHADSSA